MTQAARTIGNLFIPALNAVLPVAIAIASAVREIVSAIAALFGIQMADSVDWGDSLGSAAGATGDIADNMDSAAGSAKELKKYLAGFDELNVLPDQNSGGSGSGAGGGGSGFDIEPIDYDFLSGAVTERIDAIKAKLEPFVNWFKENLDYIMELAKNLAIVFLSWKIAQSFLDGITAIKALSTMQKINIGVGLTLAGFTIEFTGIKDAIQNGLDGLNFGSIVVGGLLGTGGTAMLGKAIGEWIAKAFSGSAVAQAITAGGGTISTGLLGAAVGGIVAGIPMFVTGVYDAIKNGLDWLNGLLIPLGSTLAGAGIGAIVGSIGGPLGAAIGAAVGLVVDGIILIVQNWDSVSTWLTETFSGVGEFFKTLWSGISTWAGEAWNSIKSGASSVWDSVVKSWNGAVDWVGSEIVAPIENFFTGLWESISASASEAWNGIKTFFEPAVNWFNELFSSFGKTAEDIFYNIGVISTGCWETIKIVWGIAADWFDVNFVQPISEFFSDMWEGISVWAKTAWSDITVFFSDTWEEIKEIAISAWNGITETWSSFATWFDTTVIQPVATFFSGLWTSISTWAIGAWNDIKSVFSGIAAWMNAYIIQPVVGLFSELWTDITVIFSNVVGFFQGVLNGVISALNSALSWIFSGINSILSDLASFSIAGYSPFAGIRTISVPQIPMLASGGFVDSGQLFIAREAGAEMVGSIGNRTAVANNDQIVAAVSQGVSNANDDVVTAIYAVAQQIIAEMREQEKQGSSVDINKAVAQAQRRNARVYGY